MNPHFERGGEVVGGSAALETDTASARTHASLGWTLLENGDRRTALHHFREALRLDPHFEAARSGLVTALKAGNPVFRVLLASSFWMARQPSWVRAAVIAGPFVGIPLIGQVAARHPASAAFLTPLLWLYAAFVLFCYIGDPLFNLLVRLHPDGRRALSPDRAAESNGIGLLLAASLVLTGVWFIADDGIALTGAVFLALYTLPVSAMFRAPAGRPRWLMAVYVGMLGLVAVSAVAIELIRRGTGRLGQNPVYDGYYVAAYALGWVFLVGVFVAGWIAFAISHAGLKR
jgi:hypothetical protein